MPIDEATRVAEQLLGPYSDEEHTKWGLVVRELRLNRVHGLDVSSVGVPRFGRRE